MLHKQVHSDTVLIFFQRFGTIRVINPTVLSFQFQEFDVLDYIDFYQTKFNDLRHPFSVLILISLQSTCFITLLTHTEVTLDTKG